MSDLPAIGNKVPTSPRDWAGEVLETVETERHRQLPADRLRVGQVWRGRLLMALAALG
jgi:hypothetical protein